MATSQSQKALYAPGEDLESIAANQAYQDALAKLTKSLDVRKNRLFDPVLLSIAEGFLGPTQTGSFGEALGRVAGKIGPAEAAAAKERQDIAAFELDLAGKGIELQRQKSKDAMVRRYLSKEDKPPSGALTAASGATSGAQPAQGALAQAQSAPGREMGIQIAPGTPGISRQEFFTLGLADGKNISDLAKEWEAIQRGRLQARENSLFNTETGRFYAAPTGNIVEIQIFNRDGSTPKTFKVPANQAAELSELARNNDAEGYFALAERITQGPKMPQAAVTRPPGASAAQTIAVPSAVAPAVPSLPRPAAQQPGASAGSAPAPLPPVPAVRPPAVPAQAAASAQAPQAAAAQGAPARTAAPAAVVPPAAVAPAQAAPAAGAPPARLRSLEEAKAEERRIEVEQAEAKKRAEALAAAGAAREIEVEPASAAARRIFGSATRIQDYLKQSPSYFGIFARPGAVAAIGNLINEAIQTPQGTLKLAGFEDSMRKMMPGIRQRDLDNVAKAAAELAEIELAFTRLYLGGQGAITEGERKIVRAIPGTVSSSPNVLRTRVKLLEKRSQFDIDVADAFRDWQKNNPGQSYLKFERDSDLYKDIKKNFEVETEKIFGGIRAIPTRERAPAQRQGASSGNAAARDKLQEILGR